VCIAYSRSILETKNRTKSLYSKDLYDVGYELRSTPNRHEHLAEDLGLHSHAALESSNLLSDTVLSLLEVAGLRLEFLQGFLLGLGQTRLLFGGGIGTDLFVGLGVQVLKGIRLNSGLDIASELLLVGLFVFLLEVLHVVSNVDTVDVVTDELSIGLLGLLVVARESGLGVGNGHATIDGTLQGTKDTGASGGSAETHIQVGLEGTGTLFSGLDFVVVSVNLFGTFVSLIQTHLFQDTTGTQQTSGISSRPVGQSKLDAVFGELVGVGSSQAHVTLDLGVHDLTDNVLVGDSDNESVFRRVVLVLGLADQSLASIVVGFTLYFFSANLESVVLMQACSCRHGTESCR
jgi:hypothetical protein